MAVVLEWCDREFSMFSVFQFVKQCASLFGSRLPDHYQSLSERVSIQDFLGKLNDTRFIVVNNLIKPNLQR